MVGLVFGGPLLVKYSDLRKASVIKCYMAVFVCMVKKAVHIELVSGLSKNDFILTLKIFISRRRIPSINYLSSAITQPIFLISLINYMKLSSFSKTKPILISSKILLF